MALERFRKRHQSIDYLLALAIFILSIFGIIMIFSASAVVSYESYENSYGYALRQLMALGLGLTIWIIMALVDYRVWKKYATFFLIITIVFLVAVFIPGLGIERNGAHRWINLGVKSFQPTEFVKLFFLIYLAAWLSKKGEDINKLSTGFIPFVAIILLVAFLIMKQPDMGTMSIVAGISMSLFFISGVAWQYILLFVGGAAVMFRLLIFAAPYRLQRLMVFLNPDGAGAHLGASYHINQALLAIGNGSWLGLGFGQSKQKYLFLPEPHTDSIFSIITEELGFLRAAIVVFVLVFIAWRGYKIAQRVPDAFGRLMATGITTWFICQAFVNIAAMLRLLPLTGVPLPFVSFGGTALIVNFAAAGILLNISRQAN